MEHDVVLSQLDVFMDHELTDEQAQRIADHLATCDSCSAQLAEAELLRAAMRHSASRFAAPQALRSRIAHASEVTEPVEPPPSRAAAHLRRSPWRWQWGGFAAMACSALLFVVTATLYFRMPDASAQLDDAVVSAHVRAMIAGDAIAVASSDRHTVKPWYAGKLDFSPPVYEFLGDGFVLLGGRLDYIDHRPVAVVVYRHLAHVISVFVEPSFGSAQAASAISRQSLRGYQVVRWSQGTLRYWAVSDVEVAQLDRLAHDIIAASVDPAAIDR